MIIAVIPARGGSKRIPGKNIRDFCGKPIIAWSIEAALATEMFDNIVVSTDDERIAEIASRHGAEVPFLRPAELADDHTGTNAVVRHAIEWFQENGQHIELVCCIYATAPFVQPRYLREAYDRLVSSDMEFAFSVTSFAFPIQRALRITNDGNMEPMWPEQALRRSQDLEEAWHDAGQFYWGNSEAFIQDLPMFASHSIPVVLPRHLVQDIDTEEDWHRAELMFEAIQKQSAS